MATIIDAAVTDVVDDNYVLTTPINGTYLLPFGTVEMQNGTLVPVGENSYLRLRVEENDENRERNRENASENDADDNEASATAEWPEKETRHLISLYKDKKPLVENRQIKTMKKMWTIITEEVNKMSKYKYTSQQCESKWKSLERAFKRNIENSKKTGRARKTCQFEKELTEILINRKNIFPDVTLDSQTSTSCLQLQELCGINNNLDNNNKTLQAPEANHSNNENEGESFSVTPKRPRKSGTIRTELQKIKQTIDIRHEEKNGLEERKLEQRERLIQELKRRNDILERLIN